MFPLDLVGQISILFTEITVFAFAHDARIAHGGFFKLLPFADTRQFGI